MEFSLNYFLSWGDWFCCFFPWLYLKCINFPGSFDFFKMLLSICISYVFQVICLISYLVFKLEVVVMAECQMFRQSCLQHILMWIYWWMRRKFLIKSTVQNKTPVSLDEVLKNVALHTKLKFSSSCSFTNVSGQHFQGIAVLGSCERHALILVYPSHLVLLYSF